MNMSIEFCDIDDDDGYLRGQICFYENIGSPTHYVYSLVEDYYFGIQFSFGPKIDFIDFDSDGDLDLFCATYILNLHYEKIYYYQNLGNIFNANFVLADSFFNLIEGYVGYPEFCDIDFDGDHDLFLGNGGGGVEFYRNLEFNSVSHNTINQPYSFTLHQNYPNPFNVQTMIPFTLDRAGKVELTVYDVLGREVRVLHATPLQAGTHEVLWNAEGFASGVYLVRLQQQSAGTLLHSTRKVVLVK